MSWSGAGIPFIGGQALSGASTILFKGSRYLVEQPVVGMEGGIVENLGKPVARIEIHGAAYESGADQFLATLSGFIGSYNEIHVPSFNSGYYFIDSGIGIMFENLKYEYVAGFGYPHYHYVLAGVLSGEFGVKLQPTISGGITYLTPNLTIAQLYGDYALPSQIQAQIYTDYVLLNTVRSQIYGTYLQNLSGNFNSGGTGYAQ